METLKGAWHFNDVLSLTKNLFHETVDFMSWERYYSEPTQFTAIYVTDGRGVAELGVPFQVNYYGENSTEIPYIDGWRPGSEKSRTVIFTSAQTVSDEFYEWFTANASPVAAFVRYNSSDIATLIGGKTAVLKCKDKKMDDNVVVETFERGGNPILQAKTVSVPGLVTADSGFDGLSSVNVSIPEFDGTVVID